MTTVKDMLERADPLRHETNQFEEDKDRIRKNVVAAASAAGGRPSPWSRATLVAAVAVLVLLAAAISSGVWSRGGATMHAAVRFEVRLAEESPAAGLTAGRIAGSGRVVYLHDEVVVTNDDIAHSRVVPDTGSSRFSVEVEFTAAGTERMRLATMDHVGKAVAILIDGEVVMAPVLREPIGASAVITGDYALAEAERIVDGIGIH